VKSNPGKAYCRELFLGNGTHWRLTGCAGVHVKVDEINIELLSAETEQKLPGWNGRIMWCGCGRNEPPFVCREYREVGFTLLRRRILSMMPWTAPTLPPTPPNTNANGTATTTTTVTAGFMTGARCHGDCRTEVYIFQPFRDREY
jgi:hypothetical protein